MTHDGFWLIIHRSLTLHIYGVIRALINLPTDIQMSEPTFRDNSQHIPNKKIPGLHCQPLSVSNNKEALKIATICKWKRQEREMTLHLWESCESLFYAGYTEVSVWAIVFVIYILYVCVCVCVHMVMSKSFRSHENLGLKIYIKSGNKQKNVWVKKWTK